MGACFAVAAAAATVVISAAGAYEQIQGNNAAAKQAQTNANFLAAQAAADANAQQGAAQVEADRIRRLGKAQLSTAIAAQAAGGVDVGSESAIKIDQTIEHNAEQDAYTTTINGANLAARTRQQGQIDKNAGQAAVNASKYQNASTLIAAAGNIVQIGANWKTSPKATTPPPGG